MPVGPDYAGRDSAGVFICLYGSHLSSAALMLTTPQKNVAIQRNASDGKSTALVLAYSAVFLLSSILRFLLALVNREANDRHIDVITVILRESRLPHGGELWESFQPKLFHWTMAQGIRLLDLRTPDSQTIFMQIVNSAAGLLLLVIIYSFLRRMPLTRSAQFWTFALVAFSPALIGIHIQATNDTFVILFVSLAILFTLAYFRYGRVGYFIGMAIMTILAGLSKGNGLVVFLALYTVMVIWFYAERPPGGAERFFPSAGLRIAWLAAYLLIVPYFGQYIERYQEQGNPFTINMTASPLPSLFAESDVGRPGVKSLRESYLSFPFISLLQNPVISSQEENNYPAHRVSLWAQLYGRTHFIHFDQWLDSWSTTNSNIMDIGRCLFLLALFPSLAGLSFFVYSGLKNLKDALPRHRFMEEAWVHVMILTFYTGFVIVYTWMYRDFSTMKAIFILPAVVSMVYFLSNGLDACFLRIRNGMARGIMHFVLASLVILYVVDAGFLLYQLAHLRGVV